MRKPLHVICITFIVAVVFGSCKQGSDAGQMIPADALVVGYLNTESFLKKLPPEEIESADVLPPDLDVPEMREILRNPDKTGIDLNQGLVAFAAKDQKGKSYIVLAGSIKNASDFETFNKSDASTTTVEESGNIRRLAFDDRVLLGWNKNHFYYVINSHVTEYAAGEQENGAQSQKATKANLNSYLNSLFKQQKKNSLAADSRFNDLMKEKGDLKIWLNAEKFINRFPTDMTAFFRAEKLVKDSRTTYVINFEDGYINASQKFYYGEELEEVVKKLFGSKLSATEFAGIPSDKINGALAMHLEPEGINEALKFLGVDGIANMALSRLDINLNDLLQSIDGKFLFAISDLNVRNSESSFASPPVDFNYLFKTGIRNKQHFQKVLDGATRMGLTSDMKFLTDDDVFISGNRNEFISQYRKNMDHKAPQWAEKISGHPFGLHIDLQAIGSGFPDAKDSSTQRISDLSRSFWKDFYAFGGDKEGNALTFEYRVNLLNESENSLKQLTRYFYEMRRLQNQTFSDQQFQGTIPIDSLRLLPE